MAIEGLSTTFKVSLNVSFDTGLLILVTGIHFLVITHENLYTNTFLVIKARNIVK